MAFDPILTAEDSINYQAQMPARTGVDVGLNLLAQYIRQKGDKKKEGIMKEEIAAILETTDNAERLKLAGGSSNAQLRNWALNEALGGGKQNEFKNVQSTFRTDKGTMGLVLRDGSIIDTGQQVGANYVINPETGMGINPVDLSTKQIGGGSGQSFRDQQNQAAIDKAQIDRDIKKGDKQADAVSKIEIWDTVKGNISASFADATTFPGMGLVPPMTESQQTAEASLTTAIPTLKEFFRQAGEGTFTAGDQLVLINMLPTRNDYPEVREKKLQTVDAIISLKLGRPVGGLSGEDAEAALWANDPKNFESDAAKAIRQQLGL